MKLELRQRVLMYLAVVAGIGIFLCTSLSLAMAQDGNSTDNKSNQQVSSQEGASDGFLQKLFINNKIEDMHHYFHLL